MASGEAGFNQIGTRFVLPGPAWSKRLFLEGSLHISPLSLPSRYVGLRSESFGDVLSNLIRVTWMIWIKDFCWLAHVGPFLGMMHIEQMDTRGR
jgi:hypothetical protein